MKILLIGGFLGSGKTSFILQLAHYMVEEMGIPNIAILENEIGEIGVDDKLIKGSGFEVRGLFSGCVCCSMAGELPVTIHKIEEELHPDWLIMEATGVAFPGTIKRNIIENLEITPKICCLADAQRWHRIYAAMNELVTNQLEDSDIILINKTDLVDEKRVEEVRESIRSINNTVEVDAMSANGELPSGLFEKVLGEV